MSKIVITFSDGLVHETEWDRDLCHQVRITGRPDRIENVDIMLQRISPDGTFYFDEIPPQGGERRGEMKAINSGNINQVYDFEDIEECKHFLRNLYIGDSKNRRRVECVDLANGQTVKMEDIPDDQVIQRAKELRSYIYGIRNDAGS